MGLGVSDKEPRLASSFPHEARASLAQRTLPCPDFMPLCGRHENHAFMHSDITLMPAPRMLKLKLKVLQEALW